MSRPPRSVAFLHHWTPAMAYIVGYWWAEGHMRVKSSGAHEIALASNDPDHLEALALVIGEKYHLRKVASDSNTYVMSFCSKEMYHDLAALGGTPCKSRTLRMPAVPAEHLPHFVRGFVDGDGSLYWNGTRPVIQIYSASARFLEELAAAIEAATGLPAPNVIANRTLWNLKWSTIRAKCLAIWLYIDNPGLAQERRAAMAAQFLAWQPRKHPAQGTITEDMRRLFSAYLP